MARTLMVGGAICGYCATGSVSSAIEPITTSTIETTAAKIGRSTKKCPKFMAAGLQRRAAEGEPRSSGTLSWVGCGTTLPPGLARISPLTMT